MSGSRIKVAGRFKPCLHMGCFDLNSFVELNQRARKVSDQLLGEVSGESGSQLLLFMVKVMVLLCDGHS
jgi:hypothetical protein